MQGTAPYHHSDCELSASCSGASRGDQHVQNFQDPTFREVTRRNHTTGYEVAGTASSNCEASLPMPQASKELPASDFASSLFPALPATAFEPVSNARNTDRDASGELPLQNLSMRRRSGYDKTEGRQVVIKRDDDTTSGSSFARPPCHVSDHCTVDALNGGGQEDAKDAGRPTHAYAHTHGQVLQTMRRPRVQ